MTEAGDQQDSGADALLDAPGANAPAPRPEYGSYVAEARAISEASAKLIATLARTELHRIVPEENTRHFRHGTGWASPASPDPSPDEAKIVSQEYSLRFDDIIAQDLAIIPRSFREIADGLARAQIGNVIEAISEGADRSGNIVDGVNRPFADAFIEMIEKIEFGVDAKGEVELPSILAAPDEVNRMVAALESQPPEYQARAEALIEEKKKAALAREEARLSRFKGPAA